MEIFGFGKNKKQKNVKIEMRGYANGVEVPVKIQNSSKPLEKELEDLDRTLKSQDAQFKLVIDAEEKYEQDKDIEALIALWEGIWKNGGLAFNGSKWTFRLPDLYIKQKRYDDALRILKKIRKSEYQEKKQSYIARIEKAKEKAAKAK